ncbi:MAG: TetR/AcrR family transcriptional regulator [Deltaproteobacteria bacterium]|nr:TetR/AcrR family transcriptional regulator [Deltaproteobacteria bacterium]
MARHGLYAECGGGREEKSKRTMARIQEAGIRLFVSNGYFGTSVADIARATGLTKAAMYAHFSGKSDLLFSLIHQYEFQYLDRVIEEVSWASGDAIDKLHRFLSFCADFGKKNQELCLLLTILSAEFIGSDNEFQPEINRIYAKFSRFLMRLVEKGQEQGVIDATLDPSSLAHVIIAIHDGILLEGYRGRDFLGKAYIRNLSRLIFDGIRPSSSHKSRHNGSEE